MSDDEMSLEEYGKRYIELGGMDDGFAWALHPDLCNRSEIMERVIKQAHGILYEHRGEVDRLRAENERLYSMLEMAYCQKIGTDTPHGLSSCGNYKDWLAMLQPNASHQSTGES